MGFDFSFVRILCSLQWEGELFGATVSFAINNWRAMKRDESDLSEFERERERGKQCEPRGALDANYCGPFAFPPSIFEGIFF